MKSDDNHQGEAAANKETRERAVLSLPTPQPAQDLNSATMVGKAAKPKRKLGSTRMNPMLPSQIAATPSSALEQKVEAEAEQQTNHILSEMCNMSSEVRARFHQHRRTDTPNTRMVCSRCRNLLLLCKRLVPCRLRMR